MIVFPVCGWIIDRSINNHFNDEDSAELRIIATAVHQALSTPRSEDPPATLQQRLNGILSRYHGASLFIAAQDGQPIFASSGTGPDLAKLIRGLIAASPVNPIQQWHDTGHTYRVLIQCPDPNRRAYTVVTAILIDHHIQFLEGFRQTLAIMTASAITLMNLLGWIAVRWGHAPLHHIVTKIRKISAHELNTRIAPETIPVELAGLAMSFNEMLGRMEEAFVRLSNFSADLAHELRTPVTNLMTQTQVALSQPRSPDEYREILYSNMEEFERMSQMIGDMFFLAQADNGLYMLNEITVDLGKEVQSLFEYYEVWADQRHGTLALQGAATVSGDRLMLRRALNNLLSNAIRHTPTGQTVRERLNPVRAMRSALLSKIPASPYRPSTCQDYSTVFSVLIRQDSGVAKGQGLG